MRVCLMTPVLVIILNAGPAAGQSFPGSVLGVGSGFSETITRKGMSPTDPRFCREWRLEVKTMEAVWISVETMDFMPTLSISWWNDASRPVDCVWDKVGFNEYVRIKGGGGTYRLGLRFHSHSRRTGTYRLEVAGSPPGILSGLKRYEVEAAYFSKVLARPGVERKPAFQVAALDGFIRALKFLERWQEIRKPMNRAVKIYLENDMLLEAAGVLEDRAQVEEMQGKYREAVETCEEAVALRIREMDGYQAALNLAWAYCLGQKAPGLMANRPRLNRALRIANRGENPGHTLEDVANVLLEGDQMREAILVLKSAREVHAEERDLTSECRVIQALSDLLVRTGEADEAESLIREVVEKSRRWGRHAPAILLLEEVGEEAKKRGDLDRTERLMQRALVLMGETGDAGVEATGWVRMGFIQRTRKKLDAAAVSFSRAVALADRAGDSGCKGRAMNGLGCIHQDRGRYEEALEWYDRAFALVKNGDDPQVIRDVVHNQILVHQTRNDADAAVAACTRGVRIFKESGGLEEEAGLCFELGYTLNRLGRREAAFKEFEKALTLYRKAGLTSRAGRVMNEMGNLEAAAGDLEAALVLYEKAHSAAAACGDGELAVWTLYNLGYDNAALGNHARAAQWYARLIPRFRKRKSVSSVGFGRFLMAVAATCMKANRPGEGLAFCGEAVGIFRAASSHRNLVEGLLQLGELNCRSGRRLAALQAYLEALRVAGEKGFSRLLGRSLGQLTVCLIPG